MSNGMYVTYFGQYTKETQYNSSLFTMAAGFRGRSQPQDLAPPPHLDFASYKFSVQTLHHSPQRKMN